MYCPDVLSRKYLNFPLLLQLSKPIAYSTLVLELFIQYCCIENNKQLYSCVLFHQQVTLKDRNLLCLPPRLSADLYNGRVGGEEGWGEER